MFLKILWKAYYWSIIGWTLCCSVVVVDRMRANASAHLPVANFTCYWIAAADGLPSLPLTLSSSHALSSLDIWSAYTIRLHLNTTVYFHTPLCRSTFNKMFTNINLKCVVHQFLSCLATCTCKKFQDERKWVHFSIAKPGWFPNSPFHPASKMDIILDNLDSYISHFEY